MLLHIETVCLSGQIEDIDNYVKTRLAHINRLLSPQVTLWRGLLGVTPGMYAFVSQLNDRVEFLDRLTTIESNKPLAKLDRENSSFTQSLPRQQLLSLIRGEPWEKAPAIGGVATVTSSDLLLSQYAEAMAWAIDMNDLAEQATGIKGTLFMDQHDGYGRVTWMSTADHISAMDHTEVTLASDAPYIERLTNGAGLNTPSTGQLTLWTRLA